MLRCLEFTKSWPARMDFCVGSASLGSKGQSSHRCELSSDMQESKREKAPATCFEATHNLS